jgi:alpha-1,2-mannosyltransferase
MEPGAAVARDGARPRAWLLCGGVAVGAFVAAAALYADFFGTNQALLWTHTDEFVYRVAGLLARQHPAQLYSVFVGEPGKEQLPFTYPPFAALVFAAFSWLSFGAWQVGIVVIDVFLVPVISYLAVRMLGHRGRGAWFAALGLAAVALWLEPVYSTIYFGQINLILLALIMADFALPDSCRWKGIATGVAAAIKLTPLLFVPYLLASRRIRAGLVSLATFAASVALGFALLPAASAQFWTSRSVSGAGGAQKIVDQSLNGMVQRLLQTRPPAGLIWSVLALLVAAAGVAVAAVASRRGLELLGVVICGVTSLLVSPISWTHHWVWTGPALALVAAGRPRPAGSPLRRRDLGARLAGTALVLGVFFAWPGHALRSAGRDKWFPEGLLRHAGHGQVGRDGWLEYTWGGATWLLGNSYVLAGLLAITAAAGYLFMTRRRYAVPAGTAPVSPSRAASAARTA